jgi:hypothetical protein
LNPESAVDLSQNISGSLSEISTQKEECPSASEVQETLLKSELNSMTGDYSTSEPELEVEKSQNTTPLTEFEVSKMMASLKCELQSINQEYRILILKMSLQIHL